MLKLVFRSSTFFAVMFATLSLATTLGAAPPAGAAATSRTTPRVVNVTSDSEPGWMPSVELEQQARKTALDFMADMDSGKYAEAYAFLADIDRKDQTLSDFSDRVRQFNSQAGAPIERRVVTVTWTKNPAHAPFPGIYAAIDLVSRFVNIDRHCGYLVLYEAPSGQAFQVMREENNFLDNATAASIAKKSSSLEVDKTWAEVSAHCPGYHPEANLQTQDARPAALRPLPEASGSQFGYPTVEAALAALHSKTGVTFTNQEGWTIVEDSATETFWSFPPPGNPAYPAAVKRQFIKKGGAVDLEMSVHCEATKQACDDLVRSFEQLNAQMSASMQGHH
jgi:hypothetical protein